MSNTVYHRSPSSGDTPSFHDMFIKRKKTLKRQLEIYMDNLNRLEIREAQCGLNASTDLSNEIEHTCGQIDRLMKELQGQEGILPVLKALSRSESIDQWASDPVSHHGCGVDTTQPVSQSSHSPTAMPDDHRAVTLDTLEA